MSKQILPTFQPFDPSFVPTLCVIIAAFYTVDNVCKVKFFANMALNFLLWGLLVFSICHANSLSTRVIGDATYAPIDKMIGAFNANIGLPINLLGGAGGLNVIYHGALSVLAISMVLQGGAAKMNFFAGLLFAAMWTLFVYTPLTHWESGVQAFVALIPGNAGLTNPGIGWLSANGGNWGLLDHAGVHHISLAAGATSLALVFLMGKASEPAYPLNKDFTMTLWYIFGMAGYVTMGDPNSVSGGTGPALLNVLMAMSSAIITASFYFVLQKLFRGQGIVSPDEETISTAAHYGIISIAAGASLVSPMWAAFFGFVTLTLCYFFNFAFDQLGLHGLACNSVFSIHFIGAATSSALTGLFASATFSSSTGVIAASAGSLYGNTVQLGRQSAGIAISLLEAFIATVIIYAFVLLVSMALGNRTFSLAANEEHLEKTAAGEAAAETAV